MSSYLNIVIPIKETGNNSEDVKDSISIVEVSRNNELYQAFSDTINIPFGSENAQELTLSDLNIVYDDIKAEVNKTQIRLDELEKHAAGNLDIIEEILNWKEYIKDKQEVLNKVNALIDILCNMKQEYRTVKHKFLYYCD